MTGIYRFHDLMLGRLLELAGPDAYVMIVSDHGFESGPLRPRGPVEPANGIGRREFLFFMDPASVPTKESKARRCSISRRLF